MLTADQARTGVMAIRGALGSGALFPKVWMRIFRIDPTRNEALPWAGRLYASRELAMLAALASDDKKERERALEVGVALNAADTATMAIAGFRKQIPAGSAIASVALGAASVALGLIAKRG